MTTSIGSPCRCLHGIPRDWLRDWPARTEHGELVRVRSACTGCGILLKPATGVRLDADSRARLAARENVGRAGSWRQFALPPMVRIGAGFGERTLVTNVPRALRFFKYDWENLDDAQLFGNVRNRLGLGRTLWPRALVTSAWDRPVIVHHGIAEKLTAKRDNSHLHLVSLVERTITSPAEAWIDDYRGSRNLHLLARYEIGRETVTHMVCVDTSTALCTTAYHHSIGRDDPKRHGLFQFAGWTAPPYDT